MEDSVRRVLELCENQGLTRKDLCEKIDIPQTTFSNWVNRGGEPKYETFCQIASFFNVPVAYLKTGNKPHTALNETIEELVNRISMLPEDKQDNVIKLMFNVLSSVE